MAIGAEVEGKLAGSVLSFIGEQVGIGVAEKSVGATILCRQPPAPFVVYGLIDRCSCFNCIAAAVFGEDIDSCALQVKRLQSIYLHYAALCVPAVHGALRSAKKLNTAYIKELVVVHILVKQRHAVNNHTYYRLVNARPQAAYVYAACHSGAVVGHNKAGYKRGNVFRGVYLPLFYHKRRYNACLLLQQEGRGLVARGVYLHLRQCDAVNYRLVFGCGGCVWRQRLCKNSAAAK